VWIENFIGREFWSLFDLDDGPRTTNHAESYHGHQREAFRRPHLKLGEFLTILQEIHHVEGERADDVRMHRVPSKQRDPANALNDARINDMKVQKFIDNFAYWSQVVYLWNN
jgi:hypothetical protein